MWVQELELHKGRKSRCCPRRAFVANKFDLEYRRGQKTPFFPFFFFFFFFFEALFFFLMKAKQTAYNNKYTTYNASTLLT